MDLNTRIQGIQRGRMRILESDGRGPDKNNPAFNHFRVDAVVEHICSADIIKGPSLAPISDQQIARGIQGNDGVIQALRSGVSE